ncbi:MAG TPA: transmembrane 220 family protein [Verrucomicrobiales bacterium]|nr:transmembrane 220 family protein [Verrucomicrobiales bacterium]
MKAFWTVVNVTGIIVFGTFAFLQRNDVDPARYHDPSRLDSLLWIGFYGLIALMFAFALGKRFSVWLLGAATLFCLIEMAMTLRGLIQNLSGDEGFVLTGVQMSARRPWVEQSREFFGALIALAASGLLWRQRWSWKRFAAAEK